MEVIAGQRLAQGNSVSVPTFDHEEGDPKADGLTIDGATRVVWVEGNYMRTDAQELAIRLKRSGDIGRARAEV